METTMLGPFTVGRLAIGTMLMGAKTPVEESHRILDRFVEAGGNLVDTADVYSDGARRKRSRRGCASTATRSCSPPSAALRSPIRAARGSHRTGSSRRATRACRMGVDIGNRNGFVIAGIASFFNPSAVVVSSGLGGGEDILLNAIRELIHQRALPPCTRDLRVVALTHPRPAGRSAPRSSLSRSSSAPSHRRAPCRDRPPCRDPGEDPGGGTRSASRRRAVVAQRGHLRDLCAVLSSDGDGVGDVHRQSD